MANSMALLLLGLLFAFSYLISSQVSARQLAESTNTAAITAARTRLLEQENKEVVNPDHYGRGGYGRYGGYGHGGYGRGGYGGYGGYHHGGYGHRSYGGFGHGGYGHGRYGRHYPPKEEKTTEQKGN